MNFKKIFLSKYFIERTRLKEVKKIGKTLIIISI